MAEIKLHDASQSVRTFYDKGIMAMDRANLDYAMDMFESALHLEPRILQIRKLLRATAIQKYKKNNPGRTTSIQNIGQQLKIKFLSKESPEKRLESAEKLMRTNPFNMRYVKLICATSVAAKLPEIAVQTLEIIIDHQPKNLAALEPLAELYREINQHDREYECRSRIIRLKPNDSIALKKLKDAAAHNTMKKSGWNSAESYRDVMKVKPEINSGSTITQIEQYLLKIKDEPENINYLRTLAELYLRTKQHDQAIHTLETYIEKNSSADPELHRQLSDAKNAKVSHEIAQAEEAGDLAYASKLKNKQSASRLNEIEERINQHPNDMQIKFEFGQLLFEKGRFTEAIQQFQLAQRNSQCRVDSLYYLARAFKQKGQFEIAMQQLETAIKELPVLDEKKKEILYELGSLCEAIGNSDQAEKAFKEIYTSDIGYRDVATKVEQTYKS